MGVLAYTYRMISVTYPHVSIVPGLSLRPGRMTLQSYAARVPAGFPSPAEDYQEEILDLADLLVRRPAATFFVRVRGDSMNGAGILDGAVLVVDKSLAPRDQDIIIAVVEGEMTVKRLCAGAAGWELHPANTAYPVRVLSEDVGLDCWGVVTAVINQFTRR